jgi:hypothetical protein
MSQWNNPELWAQDRIGKFTASVFYELMTEPKSLTDAHVAKYGHLVKEPAFVMKGGKRQFAPGYQQKLKDAVVADGKYLFGSTALTRIAKVVAERVTGTPEDRATSRDMERGIEMEPYAFMHFNKHWMPLEGASFIKYVHPLLGTVNAGATPDAIAMKGRMTLDFKCPSTDKLIRFKREVRDEDHESLMDWDPKYYWQIMVQAKLAKATHAALCYYDDRIAGGVLDYGSDNIEYNKPELTHLCGVARIFMLRAEDAKAIDAVLYSAEEEAMAMMEHFATTT